jgi:hypothetical protein
MRQRMRDKVFNGWNTIDMNDIDSNGRHTLAGPVSAVEFVKPSVRALRMTIDLSHFFS